MQTLTTEQVLALAPDASSAKAGQGLANPGKWVSLGHDERSVWGECQGSGKDPYRTQADLTGPAFHCSCPSRKFPCKHGLGLLLLAAAHPARVASLPAPPWVSEWIAKRDNNAEKKAAKVEADSAPIDAETEARREADRAKRALKREDRVRAGLAELQTWLGDLARQGLAHARQQPAQFFDSMAARMIDAQAPGVARRLREWPAIFASGDGWADRALAEAGSLQWLLHGHQRLDMLPDGLRASVRNAIGWTVAEQDLAGEPAVRDQWQVVGQIMEEDDKLRVQRTWLIGATTRQPALSLSFAAMNQPLDVSLIPGTEWDASVVFHPSGAPLRAMVRERHGVAQPITAPATDASFAESLARIATLYAGDPWLERTPWCVRQCRLAHVNDRWSLVDSTGAAVSLARAFPHVWPLLAVSGGEPVSVFGEWNGETLHPLSVFCSDGRFIALGGALA